MPDGKKLAEFTAWCQKNITGDEKGQAQIFLDRRWPLPGFHSVQRARRSRSNRSESTTVPS
jgi:negative regulator of sigma E activity